MIEFKLNLIIIESYYVGQLKKISLLITGHNM